MQTVQAAETDETAFAPPQPWSPMMEALSDRMLRHGGIHLWRQLFLSPVRDTIRFASCRLTLLVADDPPIGTSRGEGALLAQELGGAQELSRAADLVLSFRHPLVATRAAIALQRRSDRRGVRTALTTGDCTRARFTVAGECRELVIGHGIARAERALRQGLPGVIVLCGDTYGLLGTSLDEEVADAIVATESQGAEVTQASITFMPAPSR